MRSETLNIAAPPQLERFQAKWMPVRVKKTRKTKKELRP
jgi:hypothetical protein